MDIQRVSPLGECPAIRVLNCTREASQRWVGKRGGGSLTWSLALRPSVNGLPPASHCSNAASDPLLQPSLFPEGAAGAAAVAASGRGAVSRTARRRSAASAGMDSGGIACEMCEIE